jgi:hypothetical protein
LTRTIPPMSHARRPRSLLPGYSSSTPLSPPPIKAWMADNDGVLSFSSRVCEVWRSSGSARLSLTIDQQHRLLGMWHQRLGCFGSLAFRTTTTTDDRALASPCVRREGVSGALPFRLEAVLVRLVRVSVHPIDARYQLSRLLSQCEIHLPSVSDPHVSWAHCTRLTQTYNRSWPSPPKD